MLQVATVFKICGSFAILMNNPVRKFNNNIATYIHSYVHIHICIYVRGIGRGFP